MDNKKICFITAVNNERAYEECLFYIKNLDIPEGYDIEAIAIRNSYSMTNTYNKAMKDSDAKYKIYIHQDTLIINKNFIHDMLELFKNNKIGMIGVCGTKKIPTNGVWWESNNKLGKVYDSHTGEMKLLEFNKINEMYENVQAIDGLIIATQYDIEWREDLFDGWHFYDTSQCVEFNKAGYEVVVANQIKPWCIHDSGVANTANGYDKYREIFLGEYSKELYPLVSILIPTYNQTKFLKVALDSAVNQTYKNIEIIIGDDSTTNEVKELVEIYQDKYKNIIYINNGGPLGGKGKYNAENLIKATKGEYISFLMHDDIYREDKVEKMLNYFIQDAAITLVSSSRDFVDEDRNIIDRVSICNGNSDLEMYGYEAASLLIKKMNNFIGEPTTAIFKKEALKEELFDIKDTSINVLIDVSMWLDLLSKGNFVYIKDSLSLFRIHKEQNSNNKLVMFAGCIDWFNIIKEYGEKHYLNHDKKSIKEAVNLWYMKNINIVKCFNEYNLNEDELDLYNKLKLQMDLVKSNLKEYLKFNCNLCGHDLAIFKNLDIEYSDYINNMKFENYNLETYCCPYCYSFDRERMYKEYINIERISKSKEVENILHIAPEMNLRNFIKDTYKDSNYICGDLYPIDNEILQVDITQTTFEDNMFDIVLCSHVLEHIPDDIKAMKELYRIMKCGGWGILQVPVATNLESTYEDSNIVSEEDRLYYFGQEDHVRLYGMDYEDRLKSVGFKVYKYNCFEKFGEKRSIQLGLSETDCIYIVEK